MKTKTWYRFSDGNTYTDYPSLAAALRALKAQNGGSIRPVKNPGRKR